MIQIYKHFQKQATRIVCFYQFAEKTYFIRFIFIPSRLVIPYPLTQNNNCTAVASQKCFWAKAEQLF